MDSKTKKMKSQKRRIPFTMNQDAVQKTIGDWADSRLKKKKKTKKKVNEEIVDSIMDYLVNKGMAQ